MLGFKLSLNELMRAFLHQWEACEGQIRINQLMRGKDFGGSFLRMKVHVYTEKHQVWETT